VPVVVDTDVLSFLYKRDTRARLYEPHLNDPPFIISFMSLAELRRGLSNVTGVKTGEKNWKTISRDT
jgi:predicted nucleic acid-binding protein